MRRREAPLGEIFSHVEPADIDFLTHLGGHQRLDHRDRIGAVLHLRAELGAKARIPVEDNIDLLLDDGELASTPPAAANSRTASEAAVANLREPESLK